MDQCGVVELGLKSSGMAITKNGTEDLGLELWDIDARRGLRLELSRSGGGISGGPGLEVSCITIPISPTDVR